MSDHRALLCSFLLVLLGLAAVGSAAAAAPPQRYPGSGALDLDVRPGRAEVWVNGVYVGVADAYDGFPRYLWLDPGEVRLVFHVPGYRTIAREFTVTSGEVVRVKTHLEKGETVPPETLFEKPTVRADARLEADRARMSWTEESSPGGEESLQAYADLRSDPARLVLLVRPSDAAIYLDSRFLGTGQELASLHADLLIDTGAHVLEVVRPGFQTHKLEFEAAAGEVQRLEVELEKDEP